jgi:hypothetical protein
MDRTREFRWRKGAYSEEKQNIKWPTINVMMVIMMMIVMMMMMMMMILQNN